MFYERVHENVIRFPWRLDTFIIVSLRKVSSAGMSYISDWQHTTSDIDSSKSFAFGTLGMNTRQTPQSTNSPIMSERGDSLLEFGCSLTNAGHSQS